jgi:small-conductance mechanosensitive channel
MCMEKKIYSGTGVPLSTFDPFLDLGQWLVANVGNILAAVIYVILGYTIYRLIARQIARLRDQQHMSSHLTYTIDRIIKWVAALIVASAVMSQFGITLGAISGILAVVGGTILGFASINTIGNALAGLIVMISRPMSVGDRIYFKEQFADVVGIELIYTKIRTLDNVLVSIPNQELLRIEIENYGRKKIIRRQVRVTPGYNVASEQVKTVLLEAATKTPGIVTTPSPYVRITAFLDYAVEYTLYAFIQDVKHIREIDGVLYENILNSCHTHGIDISTPLLLHHV